MARPKKQTVDFFPHYARHSKTIFVLQQRFGISGYAFWFKLLEQLASHEGHYLDLNDENELEYLGAETMVSGAETLSMLTLLAKLGAIDPILWQKRLVWCQKFVDNLAEVYAKRTVSVPQKPVSVTDNPISVTDNPQSRVDESKLLNGVKTPDIKKPMKDIPIIELDNDGEPLPQVAKKYKHKGKFYARIIIWYMGQKGEPEGNANRYLKTMKDLTDIAEKQYPKKTEAELEKEIKSRILVFKKYQESKDLDWSLNGVHNNWNKILDYAQQINFNQDEV